MRKKQLAVQNAALFAEIERKQTEIDGLKLKVEEINEKCERFIKDNNQLRQGVFGLEAERRELMEENEELKSTITELAERIKVLTETLPAKETIDTLEETAVQSPSEDLNEKKEESDEEQVAISIDTDCHSSDSHITQNSSEVFADEPQETEVSAPPVATPHHFTAVDGVILDRAANIIGKVTRVAAAAISRIQQNGGDAAESLQTLALGKNESFKFQILSLSESGKDPEKLTAEMNLLADEAIAYLESL